MASYGTQIGIASFLKGLSGTMREKREREQATKDLLRELYIKDMAEKAKKGLLMRGAVEEQPGIPAAELPSYVMPILPQQIKEQPMVERKIPFATPEVKLGDYIARRTAPATPAVAAQPERPLTTEELFREVYTPLSRGEEIGKTIKIKPEETEWQSLFAKQAWIESTPELVKQASEAYGATIKPTTFGGKEYLPSRVLSDIAKLKGTKDAYQYKIFIGNLSGQQKESAVNKYAVDLAQKDLLVVPGTMTTAEKQKQLQERILYYKNWLRKGEFEPFTPYSPIGEMPGGESKTPDLEDILGD